LQPSVATLSFAYYRRNGVSVSADANALPLQSRSIRRPLADLMVERVSPGNADQ